MANQERINEIAARLTPQYIAGFFDGEGSISFCKNYTIQVLVAQTDEDILLAIAQYFGTGTVRSVKQRRGHKQGYTLTWCGQKAKAVLEQILPYLVLKQDRASIAMRMAETMIYHRKRVPEEVKAERERLGNEIREQNDSVWNRRKETLITN